MSTRVRQIAVSAFVFLAYMNFQGRAQSLDCKTYKQQKSYPFVLISEAGTDCPPIISDSLFNAISRGIHFRVNRTELLSTDPFVSLYNKELRPILKAHDMRLGQVFVRGAASPEGPYDNNIRLSKGRTKRLIEFLSEGLSTSEDALPVKASSITEDYGYLVTLMGEAKDADYNIVKAIWEKSKGDERYCKQQLMKYNKGKLWKRLLAVYFPTLRQSRVILWFIRNHKIYYVPIEAVYTPTFNVDLDTQLRITLPEPTLPAPPTQQIEYKRRHLIALRTNLLHDFLYVPQFGAAFGINTQLEYYPLDGHYTYNAGFTFSNHRHWDEHKFFQIRDLQLELRRYFKGEGQFIGPYLSAYVEGTKYGIGFSETKGWEGEGAGAGISLGYTCNLNKKGSLRLEFSASFGGFYTRFDPYIWGNPVTGDKDGLYYYDYYGNSSDFKERNHNFTCFGPTNAGIHITYDIIYRKKKAVYNNIQK